MVTDAKGLSITSTYDNLRRPLTGTYTDNTPPVTYTYDDSNVPFSKGKLTKIDNGVSIAQYTNFDLVGRLLTYRQTTDGQSYETNNIYSVSGQLLEQTYPSGRRVINTFDSNGELELVESQKSSQSALGTYASNFVRNSSGALISMQLGNGLYETAILNSRQQITELGLGTTYLNANLWKVNYDYGLADNNGNIKSQTIDTGTASYVQTYQYDSVNRLIEAKEVTGSQQTWKQNFGYDRFGNRTEFTQIVGTEQLPINNLTLPQVDVTSNRFTTGQGYEYDLNGNLTRNAHGMSFTFDGNNKQTVVRDASNNIIGRYYYDGNGKRVKKETSQEIIIFVYDSTLKLIAEYSTQSNENPQISYITRDHLGTPRVMTGPNGQVTSRRDYMPFGEAITANRSALDKYGIADRVRQGFTGYERDIDTGLDFAQARYYASAQGRFTSPDDFTNDTHPTDPASWNLYAYVRNNPLAAIDPTGAITDYLDKDTGVITTINDGKDQVIAADTAKINQMVTLSNTYGGQYWRDLSRLEASSSNNLNLTRGEFNKLASAVYAESSGGVGESQGIVNVLENRAAADGSSLMTQVSAAPGYGVYGVNSNAYSTEKGPAADQKRLNTNMAIARGIPGADITNGAYFWHGTDFRRPTAGSRAHESFYRSGFQFTSPSHDIWRLGNHPSGNRRYDYKYQSTAAHGQTTFMKLTDAWMRANGANNWRGTRR